MVDVLAFDENGLPEIFAGRVRIEATKQGNGAEVFSPSTGPTMN
ncbi:hypothetical protein [Leucobacter sp. GX24907]